VPRSARLAGMAHTRQPVSLGESASRPRWLRAVALLAGVFGIATVVAGGRVLFGPEPERAAGHVVPFVLWFNFLAGFAYLAAAVGLLRGRRWAALVSLAIAAATALVFVAFGVHVLRGGAFEQRTVAAMALRTVVWAGIAAACWARAPGAPPHPAARGAPRGPR